MQSDAPALVSAARACRAVIETLDEHPATREVDVWPQCCPIASMTCVGGA